MSTEDTRGQAVPQFSDNPAKLHHPKQELLWQQRGDPSKLICSSLTLPDLGYKLICPLLGCKSSPPEPSRTSRAGMWRWRQPGLPRLWPWLGAVNTSWEHLLNLPTPGTTSPSTVAKSHAWLCLQDQLQKWWLFNKDGRELRGRSWWGIKTPTLKQCQPRSGKELRISKAFCRT